MQVKVENTGTLERKMTIEFPWADIETRETTELNKIKGKVKIDGFRPGKAPLSVIKKQYQDSIRYEVISDLMRTGYTKAIEQEALTPAGFPNFDAKEIEEGQPFQVVATFEVFPEFEATTLNGQEIERETADLTDTDLDDTIAKLREQGKRFEKVEREAKADDEVTIHFEGFIDDQPFEGGKAEDFKIVLGSNRMIPGFEDAIIGMKAGEDRTIEVMFPEEYHAKDFAGKPAKFNIHMVEVAETVLPEVNEEFIKNYGVEDGTIETFKADLSKELQRELDMSLKMRLKRAVFDKLLEVNQVELPKALVDREIENMQKAQQEQMQQMYGVKDFPMQEASHFEEEAKKRVALGLIVEKLIKKHDIKADADKVKALIEQRASAFDEPENIIKAFYANEQLLNEMEDMAVEEQVVEFLLQEAKVKDVTKKFSDIMNRS